MSDHKAVPVRQGRTVTCKECGALVIHYRATKVIRKATWRHATPQQAYIGERSALRARLNLN